MFINAPARFWQGKTTYLRLIPPTENEFMFNMRIEDVGKNYRAKWNEDKIIRTSLGHFKDWKSLVHQPLKCMIRS